MQISVKDISKTFLMDGSTVKVIDNVSLTLERGVFASVVGTSGCGKSTLLQLLAGYYPPDSGRIVSEGNICLLPQDDLLLPWRNVIDNAAIAAEIRGSDVASARKRALQLLPLFGLEGFGNSLPSQLSGGMRQRAALLRTYIAAGDFWLLDEPFGKLDALTREAMQHWLKQVWQTLGVGVLFVTHDIEEAVLLSQKVFVMSPRPGRIINVLDVDADISDIERLDLKKRIKLLL